MAGDFPGALRAESARQNRPKTWPTLNPAGIDVDVDPSFDYEGDEPMTNEEVGAAVRRLNESMGSLTDEWTEFLRTEMDKRAADSEIAERQAENWKKSQSFIGKHGGKILAFFITAASSGLAWYGAQIRSEIQAEQRAKKVDKAIAGNKASFAEFKEKEFTQVKEDILDLQVESVNQTIMIDKGFQRLDKTMVRAFPREFPDEESLPKQDPEFRKAADDAAAKKLMYDKYKHLGPHDRGPKKPD